MIFDSNTEYCAMLSRQNSENGKIHCCIVDDHCDIVPFIHSYFRAKKISHMQKVVLLHFDAHPDLSIPSSTKIENSLNSWKQTETLYNILSEEGGIAEFILPLVSNKLLAQVVWVRSEWCDQLPDGQHLFHLLGKSFQCSVQPDNDTHDCSTHPNVTFNTAYYLDEGVVSCGKCLKLATNDQTDSENTCEVNLITTATTSTTSAALAPYEQKLYMDTDTHLFSVNNSTSNVNTGTNNMFGNNITGTFVSEKFETTTTMSTSKPIAQVPTDWILDICLDYFSTTNPFLHDLTESLVADITAQLAVEKQQSEEENKKFEDLANNQSSTYSYGVWCAYPSNNKGGGINGATKKMKDILTTYKQLTNIDSGNGSTGYISTFNGIREDAYYNPVRDNGETTLTAAEIAVVFTEIIKCGYKYLAFRHSPEDFYTTGYLVQKMRTNQSSGNSNSAFVNSVFRFDKNDKENGTGRGTDYRSKSAMKHKMKKRKTDGSKTVANNSTNNISNNNNSNSSGGSIGNSSNSSSTTTTQHCACENNKHLRRYTLDMLNFVIRNYSSDVHLFGKQSASYHTELIRAKVTAVEGIGREVVKVGISDCSHNNYVSEVKADDANKCAEESTESSNETDYTTTSPTVEPPPVPTQSDLHTLTSNFLSLYPPDKQQFAQLFLSILPILSSKTKEMIVRNDFMCLLPHHQSTTEEVDQILRDMVQFTKENFINAANRNNSSQNTATTAEMSISSTPLLNRLPLFVTISRSSGDSYTPAAQVDGIQRKVLSAVDRLLGESGGEISGEMAGTAAVNSVDVKDAQKVQDARDSSYVFVNTTDLLPTTATSVSTSACPEPLFPHLIVHDMCEDAHEKCYNLFRNKLHLTSDPLPVHKYC